MKTPSRLVSLSLVFVALSLNPSLQAGSPETESELFKNTKLVYEDTFDSALNPDFWEIRQNTTWAIVDGVLTGGPSSKEFQEDDFKGVDFGSCQIDHITLWEGL